MHAAPSDSKPCQCSCINHLLEMILRNLFKEKGVRVSECLYTLGLQPVFEGDKGDRRVTGSLSLFAGTSRVWGN